MMKKHVIHFFIIPFVANCTNIYIISIPKSGTHLVKKYFELLAYIKPNEINNIEFHHDYYSHNNLKKIRSLKKTKKFFVMRDPRDQIISYIFWGLKYSSENFRWSIYKNLSFNEILLSLICFGEQWYKTINNDIDCKGICNWYKIFLPWQKSNFYTIKFENLIGPQGGGDMNIQYEEIKKIAKYIKIDLNQSETSYIAKNIYGNTETFRNGQIGSWKNHFKKIHKETFKKIAGNLLIRLGYEKDLNW